MSLRKSSVFIYNYLAKNTVKKPYFLLEKYRIIYIVCKLKIPKLKLVFFKKKKLYTSHSRPQKSIYALAILWAACICTLWVFAFWAVNTLDFEVFDFAKSTWSWTETTSTPFGIKLWWGDNDWEKASEEVTYILLTGRWWGNHDAPELTDTLIVAGINPKNESISMLSIPRDLYVTYPGSTQKWRINAIYETNLLKWEEYAIQQLKRKLSEIIGKEIDYYLNVDFNGFIEIVDTLWWVEVTLESNFVDYEYPDGNLWYKSFILRKWTWNLDWEVALMYARSRHSTSDFDRSLRQQEILSSLRSKVWSLWYFKDRKKIIELYNIFTKYVETDMSLANMVGIGLELRSWDESKTISFNLNDTCYVGSPNCSKGWFLYVPLRELFGGASVLLADGSNVNNLDDFERINTFSDFIYESPDVYTDPVDIVIYNTTKIPLYASNLADILNSYGFTIDKETWIQSYREKEFENSILYYNGIKWDNSTVTALQEILDLQIQKRETPFIDSTTAQIEIFLADDDSF